MHNNNHPHVHHNNYNSTTSAVQAVMNTSMYAIVTPKEIESIQQECDSCLQVFSRLRLSRVVNRLLSLLEKLNQREVRLMEILDAYNHTLNEPIFSQFYQQSQALIVDSLVANTVTNHEHAKMLTEEEREAIANLKACILLRRGAVYHALEDYDNELRDVSAVMELEKNFPALRKIFMMSAWERTALVASELYQHDKAVEAWNFYLALESEYHDAYYNRALSWSALGEQKRAIQDNIRCIELNPHNVEAYINCAACYLDIGEHSLALEFLELALEQNSRHPMAYMCEFRVHFKLRDYKRALKSLRRVEKLISDPEDKYHDRMKDVWEEYGHVYHRLAKKRLCLCSKCAKTEEDKQKRRELFRKYCDKSINAFIKSRHYARTRKVTMTKTDHLIEMLRERAKIFHAEESMNEALADCALIIKVSEDSTLDIHEVYNMVGQLYIQKGMPDASLLAFSNALRQHESCEFALKGKAIALHKLGKLEEAFESFKVFDATYPDNSDVQYWIQVLERNIENRCALCGKEARENNPLKRCGRCKMVYYCSAECQRSDWTSCHKSNCDASMRLELHSTGKESPVGQHDTISSHHLSTGDNENE